MKLRGRIIAVLAAVILVIAGLAITGSRALAASPPAAELGMYLNQNATGAPSGTIPDIVNTYEYWGTAFPSSWASQVVAAGATPFVEIEPWQGGGASDCSYSSDFPSMATIAANGSAVSSYADSLGTAIKSLGHQVILTFAHEFNVGGQYPWATGGCEGTTPAQWISAWDAFVNDVRSTAGGYAYMMWAPNVDASGSTLASQYWPGASEVDMTGMDGYTAFCGCGGTFSDVFGNTVTEIKALPGESTIAQPKPYISETDISVQGTGGNESIPDWMSDMFAAGVTGFMEFSPSMVSASQWTQVEAAFQAEYGSGGGGTPPAGCSYTAAPGTSPPAIESTVTGSEVVITWGDEGGETYFEIQVALPDGALWHDSTTPAHGATYDPVPTTGTYHYKVRAGNCFGAGPWSAVKAFTVTQ